MIHKEEYTSVSAMDFQKIDCSEQAFLSRRIPTLKPVHDRLIEGLQQTLSTLIKTPCLITPQVPQSRLFASYFQQVSMPRSTYSIQVSPIDSKIFILLDNALVYHTLDRAFGGTGSAPTQVATQAFTSMEAVIVRPLLSGFCKQLQCAFENIISLNFSLEEGPINATDTKIYPSKTLMVVYPFDLSIENKVIGQLTFLWSYDCLVHIQDIKNNRDEYPMTIKKEMSQRFKNNLSQALGSVKIDLKAIVTHKHIMISEIPKWKVGDVIPIDFPEHSNLVAESIPLFTVKLGNANDKYALKIVDKV